MPTLQTENPPWPRLQCWGAWCSVCLVLICCSLPLKAVELPSSAQKYYKLLVKRPHGGTSFDRFYQAWQTHATVDELIEFLKSPSPHEEAHAVLLALTFAKQGAPENAIRQFRSLQDRRALSAELLYQKAQLEVDAHHIEIALADLEEAEQQRMLPDLDQKVVGLHSQLLQRQHQTSQAIELWTQLVGRHATDLAILSDATQAMLDQRQYDLALRFNQQRMTLVVDAEEKVNAQLQLATIHIAMQNRDAALELYEQLLSSAGIGSWLEREVVTHLDQLFRDSHRLMDWEAFLAKLIAKESNRIYLRQELARIAEDLGHFELAAQQYQAVLATSPNLRATREAYCALLARTRSFPLAIRETQSLIRDFPDDAELLLSLAKFQQAAGQSAEAETTFAAYLARHDHSAEAHLRVMAVFSEMQQSDRAEQQLRDCLRRHPSSIAANSEMADFLVRHGRQREAQPYWREIAKQGDTAVLMQLSRTLEEAEENELAFELLASRYDVLSKGRHSLQLLVDCAIRANHYREAIPWCRRLMSLANSPADIEKEVQQTGRVIALAQQTSVVIAQLAGEKIPKPSDLHLLAALYEQRGDLRAAEQCLARVSDPNTELLFQRSRLAARQRQWAKAAELLEQCIQVDAVRSEEYFSELVEIHEQSGAMDEALKVIERWKPIARNVATVTLREANLLAALGRKEQVIAILRQSLGNAPNDHELSAKLINAYLALGDVDKANELTWQLYHSAEDSDDQRRWVHTLIEIAKTQGKMAELATSFQQERERGIRPDAARMALIDVYRTSQDAAAEIELLRSVVAETPSNLTYVHRLATLQEAGGEWRAAVETLRLGLPNDKTSHTAHRIAQLCLVRGLLKDGMDALRPSDTSRQSMVEILATAETLFNAHAWAELAAFLTHCIETHPRELNLRYMKALALERNGDVTDAAELLVQLIGQTGQPDSRVSGGRFSIGAPVERVDQDGESPLTQSLGEIRQLHFAEQAIVQHLAHRREQPSTWQSLPLPADTLTAKALAYGELAQLLAYCDVARVEEWKSELRNDPWHSLVVVFREYEGMAPPSMEHLLQIVEQNPDDQGPLAILLLTAAQQPNIALPIPILERARTHFEGKDPEIMAIAGLVCRASDDLDGARWNRALDEVEALSNPSFDLLEAIVNRAIAESSKTTEEPGQAQFSLPDELVLRSIGYVVSHWSQVEALATRKRWIHDLSRILSNCDQAALLFRLWQAEVTVAERIKAMAKVDTRPERSVTAKLARVPTFPTTVSDRIPMHVLEEVFAGDGLGNAPFVTSDSRRRATWSAELPTITDLPLRLFVADALQQSDVVAMTLEELHVGKSIDADVVLWGIARGTAMGDLRQTREWFRLANDLPLSTRMREELDLALLSVALYEVSQSGQMDEAWKEQAEQALHRLTRASWHESDRAQLMGVVEYLGLRLDEGVLGSLARAVTAAEKELQVPKGKNVELTIPWHTLAAERAQQGSRQDFVQWFAKELRHLAWLSHGKSHVPTPLRATAMEIVRELIHFEAMDEVVNQLRKDAEASPWRMVEWAQIAELMGRADDAHLAYEAALKAVPNAINMRAKAIAFLARRDLALAAQQCSHLPAEMRYRLCQEWAEEYEQHPEDRDAALALLSLIVSFSDASPTFELDAPMAKKLCNFILHDPYPTRARTPAHGVYAVRGFSTFLPERVQPPHDVIIKAQIGLAQFLMQSATTRRLGFMLLSHSRRSADLNAEMAQLASRCVMPMSEEGGRLCELDGVDAPGRRMPAASDPEEYVVRWSAKAQDWTDWQSLVSSMSDRQPDQVRYLEGLADLYQCADEAFLEHAANGLNGVGLRNVVRLRQVVQAWRDRHLTCDLTPLVLNETRAEVEAGNAGIAQDVAFWATTVAELNLGGASAQTWSEVTRAFLGNEESCRNFTQRNFEMHPGVYQRERDLQRVSSFRQLTTSLLKHRVHVMGIAQVLDQNRLWEPLRLSVDLRPWVSVDRPMEGTQFLSTLPFAGDVSTFRPFVPLSNRGQATALAYALAPIIQRPAARLAYRTAIRDGMPDSWGKELLLGALSDSPESAFSGSLERERARLEQLDPVQRWEVALFVRDVLTLLKSNTGAGQPEGFSWQWMREHGNEGHGTLLSDLLRAKCLTDCGLQRMVVWNQWRDALIPVLAKDPVLEAEVMDHLAELLQRAHRAGHALPMGDTAIALEDWVSRLRGTDGRTGTWEWKGP